MKTVLVALAGLTPQVITETLYALWREGDVPAEVHVLTTLPGRQKVRETLLDPHTGAFYRFCRDYGIDHRAVRFGPETVHVITDGDGRPIEDLRTAGENAATADQIAAFIRRWAGEPDVRVHASLAGGRKTMTFYLGYALSLFGREHDRLTHVLVSEDFESHPEFFYPPREPVELRTRAGKRVSTADVRIDLVDIPFVRLRHLLPEPALLGGFAQVVARAQQELAACVGRQPVELRVQAREIVWGDRVCRLRPQPFAVYCHLALGRLAGREPLTFDDWIGEPLMEELWGRVAAEAGIAPGPASELQDAVERLAESGRGDRNFVAVVSKINGAIRRAFPPTLSRLIEVCRVGRPARYAIGIEPDRVRFSPGRRPRTRA